MAIGLGANAQSDAQAKKYVNPQWKRIVLVDYASGQAGRARQIVNDYYKKAGAKAGTPGPEMELAFETGNGTICSYGE